jgi:hypothetical protein
MPPLFEFTLVMGRKQVSETYLHIVTTAEGKYNHKHDLKSYGIVSERQKQDRQTDRRTDGRTDRQGL